MTGQDRQDELRGALDAVRTRVEDACRAAGRAPDVVTTVVVTKTFPVTDVALLAGLGVRELGEAREPEASRKVADLADLVDDDVRPALRWHCVGRLQTNKARTVARWADVVHSLDSERLARALDRAAQVAGRRVDLLVQVSLDGDPSRGGVPRPDVPALAAAVAGLGHVRLAGVMAVAPVGADPARAYATLREVADALRADHPGADVISAGMSGDLEAAVGCGATHLRVGTAVLGSRPPLQ